MTHMYEVDLVQRFGRHLICPIGNVIAFIIRVMQKTCRGTYARSRFSRRLRIYTALPEKIAGFDDEGLVNLHRFER